jgi:hypothetical protein
MTPLFCAPATTDRASPAQSPGRRTAPSARRTSRRAGSRALPGSGNRNLVTVQPEPRNDSADLLAVTAERLRRALWRSFLRYGVTGDLDTSVHAAMNVIEPVLAARDAEILRLGAVTAARRRRA